MSLVCFISGSSRGIGLEIAQHLADLGHQVILNSRDEIEDEVVDLFKDAKHPVGKLIGDVSDYQAAQAMMEQVFEQYGRLDVLINNAGITRDGLIMRMSEEDFDSVLEVNLKGAFNLIRHAAKGMIKQRSGKIINISSVSGIMGNAGQANYAASKAGLIGMTKSVAREFGARGITANAIAPGFIDTDMSRAMAEKYQEQVKQQIPLRRFGDTSDIAKAVDFLIDSDYITGQTIVVDGGLTM